MSYHSHTSLNKFITWKTKGRLLSTQNLLWIKTFKTITPDHILRAFAPSHLILSRRLKLLCKRSCDWLFRSSYDKRIISIGYCHLPCCCGNVSFSTSVCGRVLKCSTQKNVPMLLFCEDGGITTTTAEIIEGRKCFRGKVLGRIRSEAFA